MLNDTIDEQLIMHQENNRTKTENAMIEFQKGYKMYLIHESENMK